MAVQVWLVPTNALPPQPPGETLGFTSDLGQGFMPTPRCPPVHEQRWETFEPQGTILAGVFPLLLLGFSIVRGEREQVLGMNGLVFGLLLILAGFIAYWANATVQNGRRLAAASDTTKAA